jgi:hypothetical protein
MAPAVAKKVKAVVMTSSPGPTSSAMRAASSASVPDETPMAWGRASQSATSASKAATSAPRM